MSTFTNRRALARWAGAALMVAPLATMAQQAPVPVAQPQQTSQPSQSAPMASTGAAPTAQDMIKALTAPRTRSMRNLGVIAAPEADIASSAGPTAAPAPVAIVAPAAAARPPAPVPPQPVAPSRPAPATADAAIAAGAAPSIDLAIQFGFNSNQVLPASRKLLQELATALTAPQLVNKRFLIEGHTDSAGLASYNAKLSLARAEQVRFILVGYQVDAARLNVAGRGSSSPVNASDPSASENRRVRIISLEN